MQLEFLPPHRFGRFSESACDKEQGKGGRGCAAAGAELAIHDSLFSTRKTGQDVPLLAAQRNGQMRAHDRRIGRGLMLGYMMREKSAMAGALAAAVREALARRDTDHIAFHGCIDWHSAVHGTWALTAYTRMTGDIQYAPFIADILTPEKIAAERAFIASRPDFEMPYGRAWFLRLALEHRRAFGSAALTSMADDLLASLLAVYRARQPDPRRGS
jgi:hypothetical protein